VEAHLHGKVSRWRDCSAPCHNPSRRIAICCVPSMELSNVLLLLLGKCIPHSRPEVDDLVEKHSRSRSAIDGCQTASPVLVLATDVCCKPRDVNDPVVFQGPHFLGRVKVIEADVRISELQLILRRPMRKEHAGDIKIGHKIQEEKRDQACNDS
jgi:hypothetical protein